MSLPQFELFRPNSLAEALQWLDSNKDRNGKVLAGGTDLLVDIRYEIIPSGHRPPLAKPAEGIWRARHTPKPCPEALCALWNIPELKGISSDGSRIQIGAMTTITELERSSIVKEKLGGLYDGAFQLGSTLVRNRGTYGGNLCNARPAADTAIPTLALGGKLTLVSVRGRREVDHAEFTLAPGETIMQRDEILSRISFEFDWLGADYQIGSSYIKLAQRKSLEIAVACCATMAALDESGVVNSIRVALGAVAPTPILVEGVNKLAMGKRLTPALISTIARASADFARPISDHRGSLEYRKQMVEVLVRRSLSLSMHRVRKAWEAI